MATDRLPGLDRTRLGWWLVTVGLGAILGYVLLSYLGAFVLGVFLYYSTRPIQARFDERIRPPSLRTALALLTIALPVLVLVGYIIAVGLRELSALAGLDLTTYQGLLRPYLNLSSIQSPQDVLDLIRANRQQLRQAIDPATVQSLLSSLGQYVSVVISGLLQLFIALAVAFYLLRDDHRLVGWVREAMLDDENESVFLAYGQAVDQDLKTIYFGNILNAFVVAVVATIAYNALNLVAPAGLAIPIPTLLGLLTGAASLIPVIGMKIVYVPIAVYLGILALVTNASSVWFPIVVVVVAATVIDGLTELLLRPYISGRNLHVGLVLFAYILGPLLFGWYGLFLGPLLLVLIVHLARIILPDLVHGERLRPDAIGADPIPDANPENETTDTTDETPAQTAPSADAETSNDPSPDDS
jgi:predicted PurR-regulated permease PerM